MVVQQGMIQIETSAIQKLTKLTLLPINLGLLVTQPQSILHRSVLINLYTYAQSSAASVRIPHHAVSESPDKISLIGDDPH